MPLEAKLDENTRLVLGVIIIKHIMKSDDRVVIEMIQGNMLFLKLLGIRYTGELQGRKPVKGIRSRYQKRKKRREAAERNQVEVKFGQG